MPAPMTATSALRPHAARPGPRPASTPAGGCAGGRPIRASPAPGRRAGPDAAASAARSRLARPIWPRTRRLQVLGAIAALASAHAGAGQSLQGREIGDAVRRDRALQRAERQGLAAAQDRVGASPATGRAASRGERGPEAALERSARASRLSVGRSSAGHAKPSCRAAARPASSPCAGHRGAAEPAGLADDEDVRMRCRPVGSRSSAGLLRPSGPVAAAEQARQFVRRPEALADGDDDPPRTCRVAAAPSVATTIRLRHGPRPRHGTTRLFHSRGCRPEQRARWRSPTPASRRAGAQQGTAARGRVQGGGAASMTATGRSAAAQQFGGDLQVQRPVAGDRDAAPGPRRRCATASAGRRSS